jgi:hypothetical protein
MSRERGPGTHWTGGWTGPRTSMEKGRIFLTLPGFELFKPVASRYFDAQLFAYAMIILKRIVLKSNVKL